MTNTIYFYNTIRSFSSGTEEESPATSGHNTPHHHQQGGVVAAADAINSSIPPTFGLNPEAENNDGKDLACDSSGNFSSNSITSTPWSEGRKLEYSISKSFSFKELRSATRKFHNDHILGEGSFGRVFKGWIDGNKLTATKPGKGIAVAIKRLSQHSRQQKIVVKVSMNGAKSRSKAMKIAVSVTGVISAELQGDDKNQIAVTGEGIDSTYLTVLMRKKVGYTEIVSVTPITDKKEDEKKGEKKDEKTSDQVQLMYQYGPPQIYWSEAYDRHPDPCTIM